MARSIVFGLIVGMLASVAPAGEAIQVAIDVVPGDEKNVVVRDATDSVEVALLGSVELDARSIDPASLRFAGAPIVKNGAGETHRLDDVNGDGLADLVVLFSTRRLRLDDTMTSAAIEGA